MLDKDYYAKLGWDGYDNDDVDTFEHLDTPKTKATSGFEYSSHKGFSKSYKSYDFEDETFPYSRGNVWGNGLTYTPTPTPTDTTDLKQLSIVIMRQDILNAMADHCKISANQSEFQIHYRSLIMTLKQGEATVHISIPTAYYTFKQDVSGASVDYELTDVDAKALLAQPSSANIAREFLEKMPILSALQDAGFEKVDIYESNSGSMHRHPGRFGFSHVDYRKDPKNPGVVYRQANCDNFLQTDSVLYLATKRTEIYTTETRIISVKRDGTGVSGTYCRIPTVTYLYDAGKEDTDAFSGILGNSLAKTDGFEIIGCSLLGSKKPQYELVSHILSAFAESDVIPNVDHVDNTEIKSRVYQYHHGYWDRETQTWNSNKKELPEEIKSKDEKVNTQTTTSFTASSIDATKVSDTLITKKVCGVDLSAWDRYLNSKK